MPLFTTQRHPRRRTPSPPRRRRSPSPHYRSRSPRRSPSPRRRRSPPRHRHHHRSPSPRDRYHDRHHSRRRPSRSPPMVHRPWVNDDVERGHAWNEAEEEEAEAAEAMEAKRREAEEAEREEKIRASAIEHDNPEAELMAQFGLPGGFESTKGQHIEGNAGVVARVVKTKKYRQYMNRRGGFNRPLGAMK